MSLRAAIYHHWTDLLTGGRGLSPGDLKLRRLMLLNRMLLVGSALTLFFATIDRVVTGHQLDALAESGGAVAYLATFLYLRLFRNIDAAALAAALVTMFIIVGNVVVAGVRDLALFWTALFPLVAFFLLGNRRGLLLTALFGVLVLGIFAARMNGTVMAQVTPLALLNIGGTLLGIVLFIYYYESGRARAQRELEEAAEKDSLTGLFNRRHFLGRFDLEQERASRHGLPLSLLLVDIDSLRLVNDAHGHEAGDMVISEVAGRLRDCLRRHDSIARLGGEEFGVLLPHTGVLQAARVAEKLRTTVEESVIRCGGRWISVTISVGLAENVGNRASFAAVFAAADGALYNAKQAGRNRVMAS